MMREKGFSYCGLACCLSSENADCAGCRNGGCSEREWCNIQKCCRKKGLRGCWECESFPCDEPMLNKPRIKTFVKLIRDLGELELTECLERKSATVSFTMTKDSWLAIMTGAVRNRKSKTL